MRHQKNSEETNRIRRNELEYATFSATRPTLEIGCACWVGWTGCGSCAGCAGWAGWAGWARVPKSGALRQLGATKLHPAARNCTEVDFWQHDVRRERAGMHQRLRIAPRQHYLRWEKVGTLKHPDCFSSSTAALHFESLGIRTVALSANQADMCEATSTASRRGQGLECAGLRVKHWFLPPSWRRRHPSAIRSSPFATAFPQDPRARRRRGAWDELPARSAVRVRPLQYGVPLANTR